MHELSDYTLLIEEQLKQIHVPEEPVDLYEPIRYILQLGGKRIRPALTLMTANLYGQKTSKAMPAALALEVFHNFTLLHDDLMDNAFIRRGKPTVHTSWNDNIAILSGDAALILAYQFLEQLSDSVFKNTFHVFNQTAIEVCEGQQYDMDFEKRIDVSVPEYLEMIRLKTSVLIAASMKIGAICAEASSHDQNLLYEIGENLGLAFQLQDDYLDVFSDADTFGKETGGDIINNKKTYLLINALNNDNSILVNELKDWLGKTEYNPEEKIAAVKKIYNQLGTGEETQLQAISFINNAIELLNQLEVSAEKKKPIENIIFKLMYRKK
jgi:geranylgeranyl diphosphate synthase type II